MTDREKVAEDLADIGGWIAGRVGFEMARNFMRTIDEAVAMLKEQDIVRQKKISGMLDKENVIKGLQEIVDDTWMKVHADWYVSVCADALALLKEQERKKGSFDYGTQCSVCKGTIIPPKDRKVRVYFCPWCGADMRDSYEQEGR